MEKIKMDEAVSDGHGSRGEQTIPRTEPTILEQVWAIQTRLCRSAEVPVNSPPAPVADPLPGWCSNILARLKKTILSPIIRLRPGSTLNWRNYGKMMGICERYKTFITHDVERIFKEEGLDKITDAQWEKLAPYFGWEKLRDRLIAFLGRPVAEDEPLENLLDEAHERQIKHLDNLKEVAFRHLAAQNAKVVSLFFKGMAEGYKCFLGLNGEYVGDRGRTRLYLEFLAYRTEIEKFRQTKPVKSRRDLQNWVIHEAKIPIPHNDEWFDHFCDEICLRMKGVGRKRNAPPL